MGFEGDVGPFEAFSRSLWRRSPLRSCFWPGTHTQDTGLEKSRRREAAGARPMPAWNAGGNAGRAGMGAAGGGQSKHLPWPCQLLCHIPDPERQQLTRNQPSNPKKTDSNPKENTGDRARPCWIPSLWSRRNGMSVLTEQSPSHIGFVCPGVPQCIPQGMVWEQPQAGPCSWECSSLTASQSFGMEIPFAAGVGINPDGFLGYE